MIVPTPQIRLTPLTKSSPTDPDQLMWDGIRLEVVTGEILLEISTLAVQAVVRQGETFSWGGTGEPVAKLT
jgi:hypothetical protein